MTRRSLVITLHWLVVMLVLIMIKGGVSSPWALWSFVVLVAIWSGMTLAKGLMGRAGPKLSPQWRRAYPWMHRSLHILLALTAFAIFLRLIGSPLVWLDAWTMLLITLGAGTFHGLFHFWRHTALYDGALRLIIPRVLHKWL
jgi:cytochrome b561